MGIENLSGGENKAGSNIKVVGKIDLAELARRTDMPKLPRPEIYLGNLKIKLEAFSERLNREYGDLVEQNGQIKMVGEEAAADRFGVINKEKLWSEDAKKTPEEMAIDREKHPANITEIATTLLFDKVLGDDFIIMRASVHDDYENGADQLIIDKRTGAVICGLDDAILGGYDKNDVNKKAVKINGKMESGGATIKYGATIHDGKLERRELKHIPIFYFNLEKAELDGLLKSLVSGQSDISQAEKTIYAKLINSLLDQAKKYGSDSGLHPELRNNLHGFAPSLEKMQSYIQSK